MSNGEVCCILGVCCPPGGEAQVAALAALVQKRHPQIAPEACRARAIRWLERHDYFRGAAALLDED